MPVVFFDRACTPTSGEDDPAEKVGTFQNHVVVVDSVRSYPYDVALPTEAGPLRDGFLVDQMLRYLDLLGYVGVTLRSDNEFERIHKSIAAKRARDDKQTISEYTPLYSSASNGKAEERSRP